MTDLELAWRDQLNILFTASAKCSKACDEARAAHDSGEITYDKYINRCAISSAEYREAEKIVEEERLKLVLSK